MTVLNNETATFVIDLQSQSQSVGGIGGVSTATTGGTTTTGGTQTTNQQQTGQQTTGQQTTGGTSQSFSTPLFGLGRPVDFEVTPVITSEGSITLNVTVEIADFSNNLGSLVGLIPTGAQTATQGLLTNSGALMSRRKDIETVARIKDGGTIVLGGWTSERTQELTSGVPILRNLPYVGRLLFGRNLNTLEKTTLLIFLTGRILE
ncbi:MAG: hypothetical protein V2A74_09625 [bacterium]